MSKRTLKWANAGRVTVAVLTLAALLIAPVCTRLCAAKVCSTSPARGEECHGQGPMGDQAGYTYATPTKNCGARELAAVLFKADERLAQQKQLQIASAKLTVDSRLGASPAIFSAPILRWGEDQFSPGRPNFPLQTTHLRF